MLWGRREDQVHRATTYRSRLAISVGVFATRLGLDRDRAFYLTVTIVIASLYVLFAVMGKSTQALLVDLAVGTLFIVAAAIGYRRSLWIVAVALAGHGVLDLIHPTAIANPGVPVWWPPFCLSYDVSAAVYLTWLLRSGRVRATA